MTLNELQRAIEKAIRDNPRLAWNDVRVLSYVTGGPLVHRILQTGEDFTSGNFAITIEGSSTPASIGPMP